MKRIITPLGVIIRLRTRICKFSSSIGFDAFKINFFFFCKNSDMVVRVAKPKKTVFRKKNYRDSKKLVKVIRSVVNKTALEKHFRNVHVSYVTLTGGSYFGCNPLYWIPQDDTFTGRTGSKIQNVRITFKCCYNFNGVNVGGGSSGQNIFPWAKGYLRFLVFKHPKEWRNNNEAVLDDMISGGTSVNPLTAGEIILQTSNERAAHQFLNLKEIKPIYDKTVSCSFTSPHLSDSLTTALQDTPRQPGMGYHEFSVKLKDIMYQGNSGLSLVKGEQIYFCVIPSALNPNPVITDDLFGLIVDYGISYMDS